jgi:hypothetical protein
MQIMLAHSITIWLSRGNHSIWKGKAEERKCDADYAKLTDASAVYNHLTVQRQPQTDSVWKRKGEERKYGDADYTKITNASAFHNHQTVQRQPVFEKEKGR